MRRFVRHPTDIPIQVQTCNRSEDISEQCNEHCCMTDVSQGGLACELDHPITVGAVVDINIPSVWPEYHGKGEVMWCDTKNGHFEVGLRFTNMQEAYKSHMVQQVCQIELHKNIVYDSSDAST